VTIHGYGACGTCRKALAWMREHGLAATIVDITVTPPDRSLLAEAMAQLGRQALFNTSGQSYRALGAARVRAMSDEEALDALAADGRLIKRPFLIGPGGAIRTGFRPEEWRALLLPSAEA